MRFSLACALLRLTFPSLWRRASKREWQVGTTIAVFFYLGLICQVVGLASIPASRSGFLTSLATVFTPLVAWIVLRRRPSLGTAASVILALLGVSILSGMVKHAHSGFEIAPDVWQAWKVGDSLTTLGALFFTGQVLLIDHFGRKLNSAAFTPGMFVTITFLAALTFAVLLPFTGAKGSSGWLDLIRQAPFYSLLIILSVLCSLLPFWGMNKYQPHVTASQASVIYSLEPVFATGWALVVPGWISAFTGFTYANEVWSEPLVLGGSLILVANIVALWPAKPSISRAA